MITASHNPADDNGVKLVDPMVCLVSVYKKKKKKKKKKTCS